MNNPESIKVINRFYEALDVLVELKLIRGKKTFCDLYDINRRNLWFVKKDPQSNMFQISWLVHLTRDFGVSAEWILMGKGEMFSK